VREGRLVLRFLAGREPGVEFPLEDYGREVSIGRAEDVDLVLDDARVSRKHARIVEDQGRYLIEDLGSTNGIFVNAHRVQRAVLREGDRIQIGTSLMKLVISRGARPSRLDHTVLWFPPSEPAAGGATAREANSRFSGSIEEIPLFDLLQLLSTSKKSGMLDVQGPQGQGRIYIRQGQITYASLRESPELHPRKAMYRLLAWQSGTFELKPPDARQFEREIKEQPEALILEAMRQLDEIARLGKKLPPRDLRLVVARPTPPLKALDPHQLEVLKVIYTYPKSTVGQILDLSPLPDLETYRALLVLARGGYVFRGDGAPAAAPGRG
jgi:uncharacterized protein DUF4388/FHA domain-containing protein